MWEKKNSVNRKQKSVHKKKSVCKKQTSVYKKQVSVYKTKSVYKNHKRTWSLTVLRMSMNAGKRKPHVLPEPVLATAIRSRPCRWW